MSLDAKKLLILSHTQQQEPEKKGLDAISLFKSLFSQPKEMVNIGGSNPLEYTPALSEGGDSNGPEITPKTVKQSEILSKIRQNDEEREQALVPSALNEMQSQGLFVEGDATRELRERQEAKMSGPTRFAYDTLPYVLGGELVAGPKMLRAGVEGASKLAKASGFLGKEFASGVAGASIGGRPEDALGEGMLFAGTGSLLKGVAKGFNKGASKIAEMRNRTLTGEEALEKVEQMLTPDAKPKTPFGQKIVDLKSKLQTYLTSERTSLRDIEKKAKGVLPEVDLARKAEMVAGAEAKARADIINFKDTVLEPVKDIYPEFQQYVVLKRIKDRLIDNPEVKKIGSWNLESADNGLNTLFGKLSPDEYSRMIKTGQMFQDQMDGALRLQVESGLLSKEAYEAVKAGNDFYAPFKLLKFMNDNQELVASGRGLSNIKPLVKKIVGISEDDVKIADPILESAKILRQTRINAEKNQLMQSLGDLADLPNSGNDIVKLVDSNVVKARTDALEGLTDLFQGQRESLKKIKTERGGLKKTVMGLNRRIKATTDQMEDLAEQASVIAEDFGSESKIDNLINRAFVKEQKINDLSADLANGMEVLNAGIADGLPKNAGVHKEVRDKLAQLYKLVNDRRADISELRGIVSQARDLSLKDLPVPAEWEKLTYFRNGIRETIAVKKEVANAIKGYNKGQMDLLGKLKPGASLLRAGATTYNMGFQLKNILFSDMPRLAAMSKYGVDGLKDAGQFVQDAWRGIAASFKGNFEQGSALYNEFLQSGAAGSTIQRSLTPESFTRDLLGKRSVVRNILDTPAKLANAIEESTKVTGFLRGKRIEKLSNLSGKARDEAIERIVAEVRNYAGSPDFARRGILAAAGANNIFMFLNANIQGTASDLTRLAGKTGAEAQKKAMMRLSPVVVATVSLNNLNNLPGYKEEFDKLSQAEKDNYWMVPKGTFFTNDRGQKLMDYYRIPKRGIFKLVANSAEGFSDWMKERDPESGAIFRERMIDSLLPFGFSGKDLSERLQSVASSLNPIIKVPIEYLSNKNTFAKRDTVDAETLKRSPEKQYYATTPDAYVKLGEILGQSPLKLQQAVNSLTGGAMSQVLPDKPLEGRSAATELPILKSFHRSKYAVDSREKIADEYITKQADDRGDLKIKVKNFIESIEGLPREDKLEKLRAVKDEGFYKEYVRQKQQGNWDGLDYKIRSLNVKNNKRAEAISDIVDTMPDREKARAWIRHLDEIGLLTDEVSKQYVEIRNRKKNAA